jgi:hypothetical protein
MTGYERLPTHPAFARRGSGALLSRPRRVLLLPAHGGPSSADVRHPFLRESNLPLYKLSPRLVLARDRFEVPPILRDLSRYLNVSFFL